MNKKEIIKEAVKMLSEETTEAIDALFRRAYEVKKANIGTTVYLRGLIEFSNLCTKDCYYCGIRRSNSNVEHFKLSKDEILKEAQWIYENEYGSVVLQSGERSDPEFIDFVEDVLKEIKKIGNGALGITISLGEQEKETYQRWFNAGAHRYLLRIESSNPEIYRQIHPEDCDFEKRLQCLNYLKETGYQVGTGVMIGLPNQTIEDLAADIAFFKEHDIDMIGMGPFIPHHDTPFAKYAANFNPENQFMLGLKMIAATRILLQDVNIAAATALQALVDDGREQALKAGANIIMPNVTATEYRESYQLYDNKPCLDENSDQCRTCLTSRIISSGENVGWNQWGDSPHFKNRQDV